MDQVGLVRMPSFFNTVCHRHCMKRRQVLGGVAVLLGSLSGCLSGTEESMGPTASPTRSRTDSPTRSLTLGSTPAPTSPSGSQVDVPPCPDPPDSFTSDSASRFAVQFEKAFVARRTIAEQSNVASVQFPTLSGIGTSETTVDETQNGYLVHFPSEPAYTYRAGLGSTATVHADMARYTANYYLSRQRILRKEADRPVDPREDGASVQCPLD